MQELKSTADIARKLGVGTSTLRKYAAAMEEKGYRFARAANQSRMFSQRDMERFRLLKTALRENNLLLSEAVEQALFTADGQHAEYDNYKSGSVGTDMLLPEERSQEKGEADMTSKVELTSVVGVDVGVGDGVGVTSGAAMISGAKEEPALLLYSAKRAEKGDELRHLVEAVTAATSEKQNMGKGMTERIEANQPSLSRMDLNKTQGQDIHVESTAKELQPNLLRQSDQPLPSGQSIQSGQPIQSERTEGPDQLAQTMLTGQQIISQQEPVGPDWDKLYRRIEELEEGQLQLQQLNSQLTSQLAEQKNWIKERTEEERDRQLITSLRTYQGRKKKTRSSIFALLGLIPRKSREA
ncbi:hypothetical protein D3C74_26760 [compost metagenome]